MWQLCGSFWQFKRDEQNVTNAGNPDNPVITNSFSFKYKSNLLEGLNYTRSLLEGLLILILILLMPIDYLLMRK